MGYRLGGFLVLSTLALACSGGPASSTTAVSDSDAATDATTATGSTTAGTDATTGAPSLTGTDGSTTGAPATTGTTDASTTAATTQSTGIATTGSPTTGTGATTGETTGGGLECADNPKYSCDGPIDCDLNSCGGLSDYFDASGCLRPVCKMDSDCPDGQKCYIGFQFDDCLSSDFSCFPQQGACECVSTDDCGGAHCVPEELYPG